MPINRWMDKEDVVHIYNWLLLSHKKELIWVSSVGEKAMATHSSTHAWQIPWTEEPGRLKSMGSLRAGHYWVTSLSRIGEGNGNPLQCSCLENPRDGGAGGLPPMRSHRVGHDWSDLAAVAAVLLRWMKLEPLIQTEVNQKEKNMHHILTHIYGI